MLDDLERLIVRSWSAVVARGGEGTPTETLAEMRRSGWTDQPNLSAERLACAMRDLRATGDLP